ncbi:MAG TPA: matrixin family metalloprotease [Candidatus Thermoplasmatota archaeon]|nr:matrixin family metalloprotease [Candidatus Thermoplasmatota archaeon]
MFNTKIVFAMLVTGAMMLPVSGALKVDTEAVVPDFALEYLLPADFGCESGSHTYTFPDPTHPGVMASVDILCPNPNEVSLDALTDCPGTSWSHWQGPAAQAWTYTYDTTNPFGFSQANVASAWDGANAAWDAQVAKQLFAGHVFGGTSADSGVYDSYILAEFRSMGGQLRNAVGVQWAWASGGKIVHTDAAYNTNYPFALGAVANKYDLQSIAAHEMGHGYGMGHSDTSTASQCLTVYPYATLGSAHGRTLGDGDILGIQARGY